MRRLEYEIGGVSALHARKEDHTEMGHMMHQDLLTAIARCAAECDHCVYNTCLGDPNMKTCGQLCLDCAQACHSTSVFVSRMSPFMAEALRSCADICDACAAECEKFPDSEDMMRCARVCRECAGACRDASRQKAAA